MRTSPTETFLLIFAIVVSAVAPVAVIAFLYMHGPSQPREYEWRVCVDRAPPMVIGKIMYPGTCRRWEDPDPPDCVCYEE